MPRSSFYLRRRLFPYRRRRCRFRELAQTKITEHAEREIVITGAGVKREPPPLGEDGIDLSPGDGKLIAGRPAALQCSLDHDASDVATVSGKAGLQQVVRSAVDIVGPGID